MGYKSLDAFFKRLKNLPPLSQEEKKLLLNKIAKGNEGAREKFIEHNLRFVVKVAKGYRNKGIPFEDVVQAGTQGLLKAYKKYDPSRGYEFSTFARKSVMGQIVELIEKRPVMSIPERLRKLMRKYEKTKQDLTDELGEEPKIEQIVKKMNIAKEKVEQIIKFIEFKESPFDDTIKEGEIQRDYTPVSSQIRNVVLLPN